jgi:hypothetical protein
MKPGSLPLSFQIACAGCGITFKSNPGDHDNPFSFMDAMREKGWIVPLATENKPIKCPTCQNPNLSTPPSKS